MSASPSSKCPKCNQLYAKHILNLGRRSMACPVNALLPAVPDDFKSKTTLFDVFKKCKKCCVKKYVHSGSGLCLACKGMP